MPLAKKDKEFRLPKVSLLDFKSIEMDRVLTALFARIVHHGQDSRLANNDNTVEKFLAHFLDQPEKFHGFGQHPRIVQAWLETHLLDLVNRGKPGQERVAAPRPLHGDTYRFRNPKHCKDYGAAQHIYESLAHVGRGRNALERLKTFFFQGSDPMTGRADTSTLIDVETEALRSLTAEEVQTDAPRKDSRDAFPPLCPRAAEVLADDVISLLQYRDKIPRSVMVDYLKILFAFHLALYHLRLLKLLPEMVRRHGAVVADTPVGLFLDARNQPGTAVSALAEQSAELHYRRIPNFVRAYFETKKLDEWAFFLLQSGRLPGGTSRIATITVGEVLELLNERWAQERETYFQARLLNLETGVHEAHGAQPPEIEAIRGLGLGSMDTYIECLMALRGNFQRSYVVRALDSLMLKNRPGALLAQGRSKNAPRRFVLDARLLEVLLQIAVLKYEPATGAYRSTEIRIDELLTFLRERYGLHIDELPRSEGFDAPSITDREALRVNKRAFKNKLREIGFFQDLSDALVTQHVTPRYQIGGAT